MGQEDRQESIGVMLRTARLKALKARVTIDQVAEATGINESLLSQIETGRRDVRVSELGKLIAFYRPHLSHSEFEQMWRVIRGASYQNATCESLEDGRGRGEALCREGKYREALPILEAAQEFTTDHNDKASLRRIVGTAHNSMGDQALAEEELRLARKECTDAYLEAMIVANQAKNYLEMDEMGMAISMINEVKRLLEIIEQTKPVPHRKVWAELIQHLPAYMRYLEAMHTMGTTNDPARLHGASQLILESALALERRPELVGLAGWVMCHRSILLDRMGDKEAAGAAAQADLEKWGPVGGPEGPPRDCENYTLALINHGQLHRNLESLQKGFDLAERNEYMTLKSRAAYLISEHNARRAGRSVPYWAVAAIALISALVASGVVDVALAVAKNFP